MAPSQLEGPLGHRRKVLGRLGTARALLPPTSEHLSYTNWQIHLSLLFSLLFLCLPLAPELSSLSRSPREASPPRWHLQPAGIAGILRPGMLSRPRAGPQCPLLALQTLPNTTGNPPATSPALQLVGSVFSDYYFVVTGTRGKNQVFQCFSPQTAVGASVLCYAGKREYTLLIKLLEPPLLPETEKIGEGSQHHHSFLLGK